MRKLLFTAAMVISIVTTASAVSGRAFLNLDDLRKLGFEFTAGGHSPDGSFSFDLKIPKKFFVSEDVGSRPFDRVQLVQSAHKVEGEPRLSEFISGYRIESRKSAGGGHEAHVTVLLSKLETSVLVIVFQSPGPGQDPFEVMVPASVLVKQLKAGPSSAPNR